MNFLHEDRSEGSSSHDINLQHIQSLKPPLTLNCYEVEYSQHVKTIPTSNTNI